MGFTAATGGSRHRLISAAPAGAKEARSVEMWVSAEQAAAVQCGGAAKEGFPSLHQVLLCGPPSQGLETWSSTKRVEAEVPVMVAVTVVIPDTGVSGDAEKTTVVPPLLAPERFHVWRSRDQR